MKHLKLFNQENEYLDIAEYLDAPNVSYVIETDTVYYHPFIETMLVATYNVSSSGEEVTLLNDSTSWSGEGEGYGEQTYNFDINKIEEMYVDDVKLNEPVRTYNFNETGEHEVKYKFYDIENALANNTYGSSAFEYCTSLTSITIPDSVTSIGDYTFSSCFSLTSVTIGNGVTSIGDYAFQYCTSLTSITIPDSVTSIGDYAFYECSALTGITIPGSVTEIGDYTFQDCDSLTSVIIGNGVTSIGVYAFEDCTSLTSITIPESVTSIGGGAFQYCTSLTSITIPDSVTEIGESAFSVSGLVSITIPNSVTSIERWTFSHCESLTSVTIPNGVTEIKYEAFYGCSSLASVYCKPTTPPSLGSNSSAFTDNSSNRKIYVPMESVDAYKTASGWSVYASYIEGYNF